MTRTQVLREIRRMGFEEAGGGWQERRRGGALSGQGRSPFRFGRGRGRIASPTTAMSTSPAMARNARA